MTSGNKGQFTIRKATLHDLNAIKLLADRHKEELGFVLRPALEKAIADQEIFVAAVDAEVVGFVHYHHRRDQQTTLYHIIVSEPNRLQGIGQALVNSLSQEASQFERKFVLLKCPQELPANHFYEDCGFVLVGTENGKRRSLNTWRLALGSSEVET
jgi:N-acetylglutamate synthase-like GNAT family acetyltransferase